MTEKQTLQELFPDNKLMTVAECLRKLEWSSEHPADDKRGTGAITCDCGRPVTCGGWIGTEHAHCPDCGKGMQDMTGFLPASSNTAGYINYDNTILPEDGRVWIPKNVWGF